MEAVETARRPTTNVTRWLARALAPVFFVLLIKQGIREVNHLLGEQSPGDHVFSIAFLMMLVGAIVGWFTEGVGGTMMVAGYVAVAAAVTIAAVTGLAEPFDAAAMCLVTLPLFVAGVLLLRSRRRRGAR
jgi:hypothetical protein